MQKKQTTTNRMASIEIPAFLAENEEEVHLVAEGPGGPYGFAPSVNDQQFVNTCPRCRGEVSVLWIRPRHCHFCGAELQGEPRRYFLEVWDPTDLGGSMQRQGKPMPSQHDALRDALKEAIADFLGERLEAAGHVVLPKGGTS